MLVKLMSFVGTVALLAAALPRPQEPAVRRAQASRGEPLIGLSAPSQTAQVSPEQSGKIVALPVDEGGLVAAGQVVLRLNSRLEELEVDRLRELAESNLIELRARTSLDHARRQELRVQQLRDREISSDSDLQAQNYEVEIARLRLEQAGLEQQQARNELAQATERLDQRTVQSPIDGIVTQRLKHVGETVEKFVPVLEVIRLHPLWIEFDCPVAAERWFPVGADLVVAPSVRPDDVRTARIVYTSMKANPSSHTFMVRAAVDNEDRTWKAGLKMLIYPPEPAAGDPAQPGGQPGK